MILVIGYGNPLRRDDGVGWAVIAAIQAQAPPDVTCLAVHQLTPELSEAVAHADVVILIDASIEGEAGDVHITPILPCRDGTPTMTHHLSPRSLLDMTQWLYDKSPFTLLMTITGADFGVGEGLSDVVRGKVAPLADLIVWCATQSCHADLKKRTTDAL
ncbi:MAG: hydrogenase maturation protease [Phototrophicales bacterium]|nr:MAG: hydrogenase maturation protease [Phototrophicales bacterium]